MRNRKWVITGWLLIMLAIVCHYQYDPWSFYHKVTPAEEMSRIALVETAEGFLGLREADGSHQRIVDIYNAQEQLPQGYTMTYEDSWCAAFVSVCALEAKYTNIIPTECSCERQIGLLQEIGQWQEDDHAIPAPGDLIYYNWDAKKPGENTGWSDHVGIVVGTKWPFVKVIEGNYDDEVKYRILLLGDLRIRGYGLPAYDISE